MERLTRRMAGWPAWGRWVVVALIMAGFFATTSLTLRLQGIAPRAACLVLLVALTWLLAYVARVAACVDADGDMRREDRRYLAEFMPSMAAYFAVMLFVYPLHRTTDALWLKALVALAPAVPVAALAFSLFRYVTGSDEFMQRLHLQALAIAAGLVAVVSMAIGFLAAAKVVTLDGTALLLVAPGLMMTYGPVLAWAKRRYRG